MSKIRDTVVTNCEKKFLIKCLGEYKRLDGRAFNEFRPLEISFGRDWGCCYVSLGKTKVLAQTTCEIQQPKSSRPSEGTLNINIELNPLSAPQFEPGRQTDLGVQLNRLLEKCVKDSKAVDLESLCIKSNEKVWALRVDINVINHEGNILDCASVAMLASLAHFRRPDVTCDGEEFIIHSHRQRDPIPTVIHHYPTCVTYTIFNAGEFIVADPTLLEEGVADALLTIGLNGFKELCGLHLGGKAELSPDVILSTVQKSSQRASIVIEQIKSAIKLDNQLREKKEEVGFHINPPNQKTIVTADLSQCLDQWHSRKKKREKVHESKKKNVASENEIVSIGQGSAEFIPIGEKTEIDDEDVMIIEQSANKIVILDSDDEQ